LADIRPFRGIHYNVDKAGDLAKVICPPHDIITPQMQTGLYRRSEFNFVRVELGRELPGDREGDNRYTRAAAALDDWLRRGVLEVDPAPSIYIDDHQFVYGGQTCHRRDVTCLVRLEEWHRGIIRPHEGTFSGPKSDRLSLLGTLRADTSPIMALYEDRERRIAAQLDSMMSGTPALLSGEIDGEGHRIRAVSDGAVVEDIRRVLADQPLYIADGHHRYESALAYRRARRAGTGPEGDAPFDFVMMTLVDFADPGLVILPAHRLVRGAAPSQLDGLLDKLKSCFTVEEVPVSGGIVADIGRVLAGDREEIRLAMYGPGAALHALTLRDSRAAAAMMPYFHTGLYGKLDVSVVDHVIVAEMLGLTCEEAGTSLEYTNETAEAIQRVNEGEYQLAFIVRPVQPGVIKAIADAGDRMPRKSTYFYPKIPAGLVFYRFDD
jgi:uncharacterized protein (DUF1015 family)